MRGLCNRVMLLALFGAVVVSLAACQSRYQGYSKLAADSSYQRKTYDFSMKYDTVPVTVYHKAFNNAGYLKICGVVMMDVSELGMAVLKEWFRQADVIMARTNIGRGLFFAYSPRNRISMVDAGCADTDIRWQPAFQTAAMTFDGNPVMRRF